MPSNMQAKFKFTESFSEAIVPVGTVYKEKGRSYVFAKNSGAGTTAAGDVCGIFSAAAYTYGSFSVTAATIADYTDGTTTRALVAGIAGCACATLNFCWLWYEGRGTHAITTDGNVAIYNGLIAADGAIVASPNTTAATAHHAVFGIALDADASTTLSAAVLGGLGMFRWGLGDQ